VHFTRDVHAQRMSRYASKSKRSFSKEEKQIHFPRFILATKKRRKLKKEFKFKLHSYVNLYFLTEALSFSSTTTTITSACHTHIKNIFTCKLFGTIATFIILIF
jgi:hypothetical protein